MRNKVDTEMAKARVDIEAKLVPQGPSVTRHLTLPAKGKDPQWIKDEMDKMDVEGSVAEGSERVDWRAGKLSGAVYHGGEDIEVSVTISTGLEYNVNRKDCRSLSMLRYRSMSLATRYTPTSSLVRLLVRLSLYSNLKPYLSYSQDGRRNRRYVSATVSMLISPLTSSN